MINLLLGLSAMAVCLLLQAFLILLDLRYYVTHRRKSGNTTLRTSLVMVGSVMMLLVLGNLAQVMIWAVLFQFLGEFSDLRTAIYHSAVNFATLGYGDIVMSDEHRILGPLEAINGVLMIGVSTAALTAVFHEVVRHRMEKWQ